MSRVEHSRAVESASSNCLSGPLCDFCGSIRYPKDMGWHCRNCGNSSPKSETDAFVTTHIQQERTLTIRGDNTERGLPTTDATCPDCDHDEAYWDIKQLRSSDEAPTELYICTDCGHRWRRD